MEVFADFERAGKILSLSSRSNYLHLTLRGLVVPKGCAVSLPAWSACLSDCSLGFDRSSIELAKGTTVKLVDIEYLTGFLTNSGTHHYHRSSRILNEEKRELSSLDRLNSYVRKSSMHCAFAFHDLLFEKLCRICLWSWSWS